MRHFLIMLAVLAAVADPIRAWGQTEKENEEAQKQILAAIGSYPRAEMVNGRQTVMPRFTTVVTVSNYQGNLIRCEGALGIWRFDTDKGLDDKTVSAAGNDLNVSFTWTRSANGDNLYAGKPVAGWVECGGEKFQLILLPAFAPSQTVMLSVPSAKRSAKAELKAESHTAAVCNLITRAYNDDIPDYFEVKPQKNPRDLRLFKDIEVRPIRSITVPGLPYRLDEYLLFLKADAKPAALSETVANDIDRKGRIAGCALERHTIEIKADCPECASTRLFVVKTGGN